MNAPDEQSMSPHRKDTLFLFTVSGCALSGLDAYLSAQSGQQIGLCMGLGVGSGLVFGIAYIIMARILASPRQAVGLVVALCAGSVIGHLIATNLNGYVRLTGPYPQVGLLSIVLSYGLPICSLWLIISGIRWLGASSKRRHASAMLLMLAVGLWFMARLAYPDIYPGGTYLTFSFAIMLAATSAIIYRHGLRPIGHWTHRVTWAIGLALLINAFVFLQRSPPSVRLNFDESGPISGASNLAILRLITDVDGDGYSSFLGDRDCAAFDKTIHPGAPAPNHCQPNN